MNAWFLIELRAGSNAVVRIWRGTHCWRMNWQKMKSCSILCKSIEYARLFSHQNDGADMFRTCGRKAPIFAFTRARGGADQLYGERTDLIESTDDPVSND